MKGPRPVGRRFPDYGWAWPSGDLDLLLKAVLVTDDETALEMGLSWLATHNIDDAAFREQRLLSALSERFGKRLSPSPAHPRLVGLQRLLWSRSRMALRDTAQALQMFEAAGIPFLLLKGASRVAMEPGAQRGRVSHDIDILVRQSDMRPAFTLLLDAGWQATSGAGPQRLKDLAETWRATNFVKGEFGDVDVHRLAYHPTQASAADDRALWERSVETSLAGIQARAPSSADRIALAIAHGALDAHTHSDWLCDIDSCIRAGNVVWADLLDTLKERRVLAPAASALTYLAQEIGTPVPQAFLAALIDAADSSRPLHRLTLLECKPRSDFNLLSAAVRGVVKQARLWLGKRMLQGRREPVRNARVSRRQEDITSPTAMTASITPQGWRSGGPAEIVINVDLPSARRRIDWELASAKHHLAVLRHRKLFTYSGRRTLSFVVEVPPLEDGEMLIISARPSRLLRGAIDAREIEYYGAIPFRVVRLSKRTKESGKRWLNL